MVPPGEPRGTFLYCDPSDLERARSPAKFIRLQLLDDRNLLYKQFIRSIAQARMHGERGFLSTVLCDRTMGLGNKEYILEALHCLEGANFVPTGTYLKWEGILMVRGPRAAARRSEAGPSAAGSRRLAIETNDDPPPNPFLALVGVPFDTAGDNSPRTPTSSIDRDLPRARSATTDPHCRSPFSLPTGGDSISNSQRTTDSDRGGSSSSSTSRDSLSDHYSTMAVYGGNNSFSSGDCDSLPKNSTKIGPGRRKSPTSSVPQESSRHPFPKLSPNRPSGLASSTGRDRPSKPASSGSRVPGAK
jgi:hypothetical protein